MGGISQSRLAASLDPGSIPSYLTLAAAMPLVVALSAGLPAAGTLGTVVMVLRFAFVLFGIPLIFLRRRHARAVWRDRVAKLEDTWVCRRCGWAF